VGQCTQYQTNGTHKAGLSIFHGEEVFIRLPPRWHPSRAVARTKLIPTQLDIVVVISPPDLAPEECPNISAIPVHMTTVWYRTVVRHSIHRCVVRDVDSRTPRPLTAVWWRTIVELKRVQRRVTVVHPVMRGRADIKLPSRRGCTYLTPEWVG